MGTLCITPFTARSRARRCDDEIGDNGVGCAKKRIGEIQCFINY
jgi:hypothetical protein